LITHEYHNIYINYTIAFFGPIHCVSGCRIHVRVRVKSIIWEVIAILYSVRVRSKKNIWIFMLLPIVLGPFVYEIHIIIGVLVFHGKF
jgi:hypothetical protein